MLGFGEKKKTVSRGEALAARPVHLVKGELVPTADGGAKLKVPLKPGRLTGAIFRMPEGTTKTFELDALGLFVWNHCDGSNSVQQIIRKMAREHRLTMREVEVATIQFLQMLIKKGLVGMSVEKTKAD